MLPKFVRDVAKFVYGVTDVVDVTTISQDYICIFHNHFYPISKLRMYQIYFVHVH